MTSVVLIIHNVKKKKPISLMFGKFAKMGSRPSYNNSERNRGGLSSLAIFSSLCFIIFSIELNCFLTFSICTLAYRCLVQAHYVSHLVDLLYGPTKPTDAGAHTLYRPSTWTSLDMPSLVTHRMVYSSSFKALMWSSVSINLVYGAPVAEQSAKISLSVANTWS